MALQKEITLDSGVVLTQAYIIINKISLIYSDNKAIVNVLIYNDASSYNLGKPEVINLTHICEDTDYATYFEESVLMGNGICPLDNGYDWLLTLTQYDGATEA